MLNSLMIRSTNSVNQFLQPVLNLIPIVINMNAEVITISMSPSIVCDLKFGTETLASNCNLCT